MLSITNDSEKQFFNFIFISTGLFILLTHKKGSRRSTLSNRHLACFRKCQDIEDEIETNIQIKKIFLPQLSGWGLTVTNAVKCMTFRISHSYYRSVFCKYFRISKDFCL